MPLLRCSCTSASADKSPIRNRNDISPKKEPIQVDKPNSEAVPELPKAMVEHGPTAGDYELLAVIGHACDGAAKVSVARHLRSGSLVAVKRIHLEECSIDPKFIQFCQNRKQKNEVRMHRQLSHDNLLDLSQVFIHGHHLWVVMPLMAYGSCLDLIHAHFQEGLPEMALAYILKDVLRALEYIHNRGVVHRGVRASHILISAEGEVKLTGMRHCCSHLAGGRRKRVLHELPDHFINNLLWASPELLEQNLNGYDTKTDIYSLGVTACELANGEAPYCHVPTTQMLLEKLEGRTPILLDARTLKELQLEYGDTDQEPGEDSNIMASKERVGQEGTTMSTRTFSSHFHQFVELCLTGDPKQRPSATTLLQHPFFKQIKRRSSSLQPLPELLRPVNPISPSTLPATTEEADVNKITAQLEDVDLDEPWDF